MSATYIHKGESIEHTPATDLPSGSVVVLEDIVGIATRRIPAGQVGALSLCGVFTMPKETGASKAIAAGKRVFWHPGNSIVQTGAGGGSATFLGHCIKDAADDDATVMIRLAVRG
jgi:predicted RecA/RadA family phage recombinase